MRARGARGWPAGVRAGGGACRVVMGHVRVDVREGCAGAALGGSSVAYCVSGWTVAHWRSFSQPLMFAVVVRAAARPDRAHAATRWVYVRWRWRTPTTAMGGGRARAGDRGAGRSWRAARGGTAPAARGARAHGCEATASAARGARLCKRGQPSCRG